MATCMLSTTIKDHSENPLRGVRFFVKVASSVIGGELFQPAEFNCETDARGIVRFKVVQGASVTVSANHPSFATPITFTVPAQEAYDLKSLL